LGYYVTGSDEDAYPPTSDIITNAGIEWENHHDPQNLVRWGKPDLVVVGNQVREGNEEFEAAKKLQIPFVSESEFYFELTEDRVRVAICGTHGKTTTASLLAWMLECAGMDPGFRLGTTSRDFSTSGRLGTGPFILEGDEYTTSPWDARPKFLHTHPTMVAITRIEWDHPDVFPTFDSYRQSFRDLAQVVPAHGLLVLCGDDRECVRLESEAKCKVVTYGFRMGTDYQIEAESLGEAQRVTVTPADEQPFTFELALSGRHNAANATAAWILASKLGADADSLRRACATFKGASRRFEILGAVGGVTVVDDYAHHPTEVAATLSAARSRFKGRILGLYVPHTYSRTKALLQEYRDCFKDADTMLVGPIEPARERHLEGTVSSADVVAVAKPSSQDIRVVASPEEAIEILLASAQEGDAIVCMTVRGFEDLAKRLVKGLEAKHAVAG
jgi:UDP-N-acetylmuramate--L-alanine ligase